MLNNKSPCPKRNEETDYINNMDETKQALNRYKSTIDHCEVNAGQSFNTTTELQKLLDTLRGEREHNFTLPLWVTESVYQDLIKIEVLDFYNFCKTPTKQRFIISGIFEQLKLYQLIRSDVDLVDGEHKVRIFSTHDILISCLLQVFQVYDMIPPPFGSSLVIEQYNTSGGQLSSRILYFNDTSKEPIPQYLPLCNHSEYCPQDQFHQLLDTFIIQDWDEECGFKHTTNSYTYVILIIIILTIILVIIFFKSIPFRCCRSSYQTFS